MRHNNNRSRSNRENLVNAKNAQSDWIMKEKPINAARKKHLKKKKSKKDLEEKSEEGLREMLRAVYVFPTTSNVKNFFFPTQKIFINASRTQAVLLSLYLHSDTMNLYTQPWSIVARSDWTFRRRTWTGKCMWCWKYTLQKILSLFSFFHFTSFNVFVLILLTVPNIWFTFQHRSKLLEKLQSQMNQPCSQWDKKML